MNAQRRSVVMFAAACVAGCGGGSSAGGLITQSAQQQRQIVVVDGDSLADVNFPLTTWPAQLAEQAPQNDYAFEAVRGQRTLDILGRFDATLAQARGRAGWYILFAGTNDVRLGISADAAWTGITFMWDRMRQAGVKVIAATVTSLPPTMADAERNRQELNRRVRNAAGYWDGLVDIDRMFPTLDDPGLADTLHFSPLGNRMVEAAVLQAMQP